MIFTSEDAITTQSGLSLQVVPLVCRRPITGERRRARSALNKTIGYEEQIEKQLDSNDEKFFDMNDIEKISDIVINDGLQSSNVKG